MIQIVKDNLLISEVMDVLSRVQLISLGIPIGVAVLLTMKFGRAATPPSITDDSS